MSRSVPRSINCRVDVDNKIWVLAQYDANDSRWHSFNNQPALTAFLAKANLKCPPKCITEEQCNRLTDEGIKRIVMLEKEVSRYKALLEQAQKHLGAASPAVIARANSLPVNRVTTGTSSSGSSATDASLTAPPNPLETKLGSYSAGLQKKFENKMSGAKRRGSGNSIASDASDSGPASLPQPSGLSRSASSNSVSSAVPALGRRDNPQSSVQQLKSLLRQNKPTLLSLDPYATDNSEAAEASARSSQSTHTADSGTPDGRSISSTPTGSVLGGARGVASSDDDNYWTESDGSVYDRHRDLEGHVSDDLGYNSEHSTLPAVVRPRSPVETQPRKLRRTNSGSERVAGIALKDEGSRDSIAATATSDNTLVDQSPRRTLSADSLASLNSNSNSNSRSRSAAPAAKRTWAPAPEFRAEYRAEEDSCMSMRLSQDDDESRSMLFAQLGDESRLSTTNTMQRAPEHTIPPAPPSSSPVVSIFGTIMKSVKSLFSPAESWGSTAASSASSARYTSSYGSVYSAESAVAAAFSNLEPASQPHISSATAAPEAVREPSPFEELVDAEPEEPQESIPAPVLTIDWAKITTAEQEKLKPIIDAVKKAKLPVNIATSLFRGIVTKECSPIDCGVQMSNILRLMLRESKPAKSSSNASKGDSAAPADSTSASVVSIVGKISKLLTKLYTRNKKIAVAEGLIVKTICACCIAQIVLHLHLYTANPALCTNQEARDSLVETVSVALERLVLMLNSLFLLPADVPWILASNGNIDQVASAIANEKYKNTAKIDHPEIGSPLSQEKTHIEMFVDHLKEHYTQSSVWSTVRDSVLRYDYSYQRDLISPVKVQLPPSQRVRPSTKPTVSQPDPLTASAVPLFDILSSQPDGPSAMLPPRGSGARRNSADGAALAGANRAGFNTVAPSLLSRLAPAAAAPVPAIPSLIGELLKQTKMRAKQKDSSEDLFAGITTGASSSAAAGSTATSTTTMGAAGASSAGATAVPGKRKNALLSNKPPALGHRANMGVKKKVVISAKTIAATSMSSALQASALSSSMRPTNGPLTGAGTSSSSSNNGGAVDFTKTPRKAITFSQATPQSTQDPYSFTGDGYFTSQRSSSSAKRYRDTTVIESTPMEMLQPRRASGSSSRALTGHNYLSSPSPENSGNKRSRLNISGESRSSSSSGGSRHGRSSAGVPLSNLLCAAEDEDELFTPAGPWRHAALRGSSSSSGGGFNVDADADGFHYLPPSAHSPARSPEASNSTSRR